MDWKLGSFVPEQGGYYAGVVRGENGAPDHHLFVAPEDASADEVRWGKYGKSIEGARLVNDGAANTEALIAAGECHQTTGLKGNYDRVRAVRRLTVGRSK